MNSFYSMNSLNSITLKGIGWVTHEGFGCIRCGLRRAFESGETAHSLAKKGIFSHPFKNFGRLDTLSRMTAYAVALALQDAGIEYMPGRKQDIGIIGTNSEGSLRSDLEYFEDYVSSGRTTSRGNLFIYTLPSSPAGESAIHFGLLGPVLYAAGKGNSLAPLLDSAVEMLLSEETPVVLAGKAEEQEAIYFVLDAMSSPDHPFLCDISVARRIVESEHEIAGMVQKFSFGEAGKA
jgi:3-oxoacyl-(acyl-carrier-protein) synthase